MVHIYECFKCNQASAVLYFTSVCSATLQLLYSGCGIPRLAMSELLLCLTSSLLPSSPPHTLFCPSTYSADDAVGATNTTAATLSILPVLFPPLYTTWLRGHCFTWQQRSILLFPFSLSYSYSFFHCYSYSSV